MASTTALWFPIETAFAEIEQLCIEARAAEVALRRKQDEAALLAAMTSGRTVSLRVEEPTPDDPRQARAQELSRDLAFREAHPDGPDLVELRSKLRKRISWLKSELSVALTEHEVYYALFPLVVYTDELVASITRGQSLRWEPLQSELYEVDNGGELFFSILEERLRKDETAPIVFEVFYFCLVDGFVGMYQGDPRKLEEYRARVAQRIPLRPISDRPTGRDRAPVELVAFPWRFYAIAAAAIAITWALFALVAPTTLAT